MKTIISEKSLTSKHIHTDKSETSIKLLPSGNYSSNGVNIKAEFKDRNKYSIVISCSSGCAMSCSFCHLTQKNALFTKLSTESVLQNIKDSILSEFAIHPEISTKYIKLCWMGMGEAILSPQLVKDVTLELLDWVMVNNYAKGLDGVDLATVLPKINDSWMTIFDSLNVSLNTYNINPNNNIVPNTEKESNIKNYSNRSNFRLFYSLHSTEQATRDSIIPNAMPIEKAINKIKDFSNRTNINIIIHYMFMNGINDSKEQLTGLQDFINTNELENFEIRILRYNSHDDNISESEDLSTILNDFSKNIDSFKVQFSAGAEILSACGQFVVEDFTSVNA